MAMNKNKTDIKDNQIKGSTDGIIRYRRLEKTRNIFPYGSNHSTPLQPRRRVQKQHTAIALKKVHSCLTVNETPNSKCRRSVSLLEFTTTGSTTVNKSSAPEELETTACCSSEMMMTPTDHTTSIIVGLPVEQKELVLAQRVYKSFVLNAWRQRIRKAKDYERDLHHMASQVENLNIQTVVLHSLLESEKKRVAVCYDEVSHYRVTLEDETRQKAALKAEKEAKEKELERLEDCKTSLLTQNENMKNELMTIRKDFKALELQLTRERDKISKLREDKKVLLEKMQVTEHDLKNKSNLVEKLQNENTSLQKQLKEQKGAALLAEVTKQEAQVSVFELEQETTNLKNKVNDMKRTYNEMEDKLQDLELTIQQQSYVNKEMAKLCKEHLAELGKLQIDLAKCREQRWINCFTKVVSVLIYFPASIIYNVAFPLPLVSMSSNTSS